MARIMVVHSTDPALFIELTDPDNEADYDGSCTGCGYTVSEGGTRWTSLADAVMAADVHLDHQHWEA